MILVVDNAEKALQEIPGVGPAIAKDLTRIDITSVEELRGKDPEELYEKLCFARSEQIDRCVLYVFRCAVCYASNETHNPELLKWWNWK